MCIIGMPSTNDLRSCYLSLEVSSPMNFIDKSNKYWKQKVLYLRSEKEGEMIRVWLDAGSSYQSQWWLVHPWRSIPLNSGSRVVQKVREGCVGGCHVWSTTKVKRVSMNKNFLKTRDWVSSVMDGAMINGCWGAR